VARSERDLLDVFYHREVLTISCFCNRFVNRATCRPYFLSLLDWTGDVARALGLPRRESSRRLWGLYGLKSRASVETSLDAADAGVRATVSVGTAGQGVIFLLYDQSPRQPEPLRQAQS
jgi:hypothetical protein